MSKGTYGNPAWRKVVETMTEKYNGTTVVYDGPVSSCVKRLRSLFPAYACFVARPTESDRDYVINVHRLARKLDDDPYTDLLWGILTGYHAADAQRIADAREPLSIRKAAGGTSINLELFDEGVWYSESEKNAYFQKQTGGAVEKKKGPDDTTKVLVDVLNDFKPDLFATSGHATERGWKIGYSYNNGTFRCRDGVLVGVDLNGRGFPVRSTNPKIYLPVGNCLMGHVIDEQSMALAWMRSGGVNQMIGYVVSTWYGRGGWGVQEYLFDLPGRYTLSEAFYFNNQTIVHALETRFPKTARAELNTWNIETDRQLLSKLARQIGYRESDEGVKDNLGLLWDRDTVALYGDPAWAARLSPRNLPIDTQLKESEAIYTFRITAKRDGQPNRPLAMLLPHRIKDIRVIRGAEFKPLITDNFIMLTAGPKLEQGKTYEVVFQAQRIPSPD